MGSQVGSQGVVDGSQNITIAYIFCTESMLFSVMLQRKYVGSGLFSRSIDKLE